MKVCLLVKQEKKAQGAVGSALSTQEKYAIVILMRKLLPRILFLFLFFTASSPTFAASVAGEVKTLDTLLSELSTKAVILTGLWIGAVFLLIYLTKNREEIKKYFFLAIALPTILTSTFLIGSTVYLNTVSATKGPVHWHADFEIYYCGTPVDLKNPTALSNRIGTPTFHEHNDNRLHVEGVVLNKEDVSFGRFVELIGGKINSNSITLPTEQGELIMVDGEECPDGRLAEVNAFLYSVQGNNLGRARFADITALSRYVLKSSSAVPPGDCIIIEFAEYKSRSDKLCKSYKVQILKGELNYGS